MRKKRIYGLALIMTVIISAGCVLGGCGQSEAGTVSSSNREEDTKADVQEVLSIDDQNAKQTPQKEETVHVSADATGKPDEISVEATLENPTQSAQIRDVTNLLDVENKQGDERYAYGDEVTDSSGVRTIYWENLGEDVTYEGKSEKTLPVQVNISYYLDGNSISPEALAGKSGQVRICFEYKNQETREVVIDGTRISTHVPFAAISMVSFPKEHFKNISVENGKIMTIGEQQMIVGYAFPGLKSSLKLKDLEATKEIDVPDHVEITADVTDFSLDYTATIITNGLLAEADLKQLDDAKDLADGMEELMDASGKLTDGMQELSDGSKTFAGYLDTYTDGVTALNDGLEELSKGSSQMDESLSEAAKELKAKLDEWDTTVGKMQAAMAGSTSDGVKSRLMQDTANLQKSLQSASEALSGIDWESYDASSVVQKAKDTAATAAADAIGSAEIEGLTDEQKEALKEAIRTEIDSAEYDVSAGAVDTAMKQTDQALDDLSDAAASFSGLQESLSAMTGVAGDAEQENPFSSMLAEIDTDELRTMIDQFSAGMHELSVGADTIREGAKTLAESGSELTEGYEKITDGEEALLDGMKAFDKDGIGKLSELAGDDLTDMISRVQALQKADQEYTNFSGLTDGTKGSVRFIIETEKIKAE